jgi:hypothetical protein
MIRFSILPAVEYNAGDKSPSKSEEIIKGVKVHVHKFNNRPRPDKSRIVIIPTFFEFGCESLIPLYCIPQLMQGKYRGHYSIVIGWFGREYLYRHLVDEYWELDESYQHLREYARAFHHKSKNLRKLEKKVAEIGTVIPTSEISNIAVYPRILKCSIKRNVVCEGRVSQFKDYQQCQKCGAIYPAIGLFDDCVASRKKACWVPSPDIEKVELAAKELPSNPVGVTARGRQCYGRNLTSEFYERLIWLLEDMGYNPVWLGEKATTLPCPCGRIFDFSRHPNSRDLEQTLSYVANMKFTVQFWTASTRLAGLVGTPYILFESPDQIWGNGQEGYRLHLTSRGPKKLVVAHFRSVMENANKALRVVESSVRDIQKKDYSTVMGLVESELSIRNMIRAARNRISWF